MELAHEARPAGQRRSDERNETRAAIRALFPHRGCVTLVRPAVDEAQLREAARSESLRPEFVAAMEELKARVLREAPLKRLMGELVDGRSLVAFATCLVEAMNTPGTVPSIPNAWGSVVASRAAEASDAALARVKETLAGARGSLPDALGWSNAAVGALGEAIGVYDSMAIHDFRTSERRAGVVAAAGEEARAQGEALLRESREAAERAAEAALGAAKLELIGRSGGDALGDDDDGEALEASGGFAHRVAKLSLEFESSFPLGPAVHEGCAPFVKALADAADRHSLARLAARERAERALHVECAAAQAEVRRVSEVGVQLGARLASAEAAAEAAASEAADLKAELAMARAEAKEVAEKAAAEEARAAGLEERLSAAESRRVGEAEEWRARLSGAEEKAEAALSAERERAEAARAEAEAKVEGLRRELEESRAEGVRAEAERAAVVAEAQRALEAAQSEAAEKAETARAAHASLGAEFEAARAEWEGFTESVDAEREEAKAKLSLLEAELSASSQAEAVARQAGVHAALTDYIDAISAASSQQGAQVAAISEERDLLREQLALFHERAALLPVRYASELFGASEPADNFKEKLASKPSVGAEELAGTAENLADAHLGNIAAVASLAVRKATPWARRTWSSMFASEQRDESAAAAEGAAPAPAAPAPTAPRDDGPPPPPPETPKAAAPAAAAAADGDLTDIPLPPTPEELSGEAGPPHHPQ
jgi:hypothetical protein